jgi:arginyl-tRNA synthetase
MHDIDLKTQPATTADAAAFADTLSRILAEGDRYGRSNDGAGRRVLVEYVSTNPNGPISVDGGRSAALGDAIASLLAAAGFDVTREFYVNDAINPSQMDNFGKSVLHRYRELLASAANYGSLSLQDSDSPFPERERGGGRGVGADEPNWLYGGDYVTDIARTILAEYGSRFEDANVDDPQTIQVFRGLAQSGMIAIQKADLAAFGVSFDNWFSEASLHESGRVRQGIALLAERGYTYEKDGAVWLTSAALGDDNDRVLVRANGTPTYIAGDAAYHKDKFDRGFDLAVDVWGADHAGYIARTRAAVAALGYDADRLQILLYRPVRIVKDGEFVKASKRRGDVLELASDLIDEIGCDAARFLYLTRPADADLDIDIDLAKRSDLTNPVYSVQLAYTRLSQALDAKTGTASEPDSSDPRPFREGPGIASEIDLVSKLSEYQSVLQHAARDRAPERITDYLRDLATIVHTVCDSATAAADLQTTKAHMALAEASRIVMRNALAILGVSAPAQMPS